jgi:hypothetical protein
MSFPLLVVVSICSVRLLNATPRSSNCVSRSMSCGRDRPNRSRRQTTKISLLRTVSSARWRPGRSALAPLDVSWKLRSQPADWSASLFKTLVMRWADRCPPQGRHHGNRHFRAVAGTGVAFHCGTMTSVHCDPPSFEELMGDIRERDWRSLVCKLNG